MTAALSLRRIKKSYGAVEALKGVDLDVPQGKVMAICGDNGVNIANFTLGRSGVGQDAIALLYLDQQIDPKVVDDQVGRLTFTTDLAAGIIHLLDTGAEFGSYNLTNSGDPMSWYQIAALVYELTGHDPARVSPVGTAQYFAGRQAAPRPLDSTLDLTRIAASGFVPAPAIERLRQYLAAAASGSTAPHPASERSAP